MTLSFSLERMREWLGPDHPVVRRLLSKESPDALASRLIAETKLDDAEIRKRLWLGGKAAVDASLDPMIGLARAVDADARAIRSGTRMKLKRRLQRPRPESLQQGSRPWHQCPTRDATLRCAERRFGAGVGRERRTRRPVTYLGRGFRAGQPAHHHLEFRTARLKVKDQLDMRTPFCISTNNDIVVETRAVR